MRTAGTSIPPTAGARAEFLLAGGWRAERWSCCLFTHVLLPDYFELDLKQAGSRKLFIKQNEVAAGRTAMVEGET